MLKLEFDINKDWLIYFKNKLNKNTNIDTIFIDARYLKNNMEKSFLNNEKDLYLILSNMFWSFDINIKVEVFPKYFYLWAINTEKWIIVIWQPNHTSNFYTWLIWHELSHFMLSKFKLNRFVEEIICFMFEKEIIYFFDKVDLNDFLFFKNVDEFHLKAMEYAKKYSLEFKKYYNNWDLNWLINFITKKVENKDKNINIEKSLTSYLDKINE